MIAASGLVVVVRTAGERTFEACRALLLRQVPEQTVHVVDERPFEAALRRCYQIGIESGAEWMLTVDADVLVRDGAARELLGVAEQLPERYVQVEGRIHDKLKGGYREAGHRVYRVKHLAKALAAVPAPGEEIRPEFATLLRLSRLGHPSLKCETVFGIHDYEQFYRDLYRKALVHGQKHPQWLVEVLPRWKALAERDADFTVAIRGYCDGFQTFTKARIDTREYRDRAERALEELGLEEKDALGIDRGTLDMIAALQAGLLASEQGGGGDRATMQARAAAGSRRLGGVRLGLFVLGSLFNRLGDRVQRAALGE